MRLIDADELKAGVGIAINGMIEGDETEEELKLLGLIKATLEAAIDITPTIEAEPVRHGRWVSDEADILFHCSKCGAQISTSWDYEDLQWDYCPDCGAKMDKEE